MIPSQHAGCDTAVIQRAVFPLKYRAARPKYRLWSATAYAVAVWGTF
jgi:hypothetical protein